MTSKLDTFLRTYEEQLLLHHTWAENIPKRQRYMKNVRETIEGKGVSWVGQGPIYELTLMLMGLKKPKSLMQLREVLKDGTNPNA